MNIRFFLVAAISLPAVTALADEVKASPSSSFIQSSTVRWESIRLQPRLIGFAAAVPGGPQRMFRRKVAQGLMFFTLGESTDTAPQALQQYRDEWDAREEWDADDYSGTLRAVNTDCSLRYRGTTDSFPLRKGGEIVETPEIESYAPLTTQSVAPGTGGTIQRKILGGGDVRVLSGTTHSGRALGQYDESFSAEDREEDALRRVARQLALPVDRRARGAVQLGDEPVAFFTRRGSDQAWLIQQTRLTCTFAVRSAGSLTARVEYRVGAETRVETFAVTNPRNGTVTVVVGAVPRSYKELFKTLEPVAHQIEIEDADVRYQLDAVTLIESPRP